MVCPANSSYSFRATALILCRMFIHIMEVCMSTGFRFSSNILKMTGSWTWSFFVRPSGYRYMVFPAISSYSFGATALIFCRMFIHIMEVCMSTGFWWSGGGIICILQTHFIFKKSLLTKQKHISFLVYICGSAYRQNLWAGLIIKNPRWYEQHIYETVCHTTNVT
jgi:hypothetical protein